MFPAGLVESVPEWLRVAAMLLLSGVVLYITISRTTK